jgi:hypothetical protein
MNGSDLNSEPVLWTLAALFLFHIIPVNLLLGGTLLSVVSSASASESAFRLRAWVFRMLPGALGWALWFGFLMEWTSRSVLPVSAAGSSEPILRESAGGSATALIHEFSIAGNRPLPDLLALSLLVFASMVLGWKWLNKSQPRRGSGFLSAWMLLLLASATYLCARASNMPELALVSPGTELITSLFDLLGSNSPGLGAVLKNGPSFAARYAHIFLASAAITGLLLAVHGFRTRMSDPDHGSYVQSLGLRWFTLVTAGQIIIGFWLLISLPESVKSQFLGGSIAATSALVTGIILAIGVLMVAVHAMDAEEPGRPLIICLTVMTFLLAAMSLLREQVNVSTRWPEGIEGLTLSGGGVPGSFWLFMATAPLFGAWLWRRLNTAS